MNTYLMAYARIVKDPEFGKMLDDYCLWGVFDEEQLNEEYSKCRDEVTGIPIIKAIFMTDNNLKKHVRVAIKQLDKVAKGMNEVDSMFDRNVEIFGKK